MFRRIVIERDVRVCREMRNFYSWNKLILFFKLVQRILFPIMEVIIT